MVRARSVASDAFIAIPESPDLQTVCIQASAPVALGYVIGVVVLESFSRLGSGLIQIA
jgi:hypothetical protein